jgi:hypothetical protein
VHSDAARRAQNNAEEHHVLDFIVSLIGDSTHVTTVIIVTVNIGSADTLTVRTNTFQLSTCTTVDIKRCSLVS